MFLQPPSRAGNSSLPILLGSVALVLALAAAGGLLYFRMKATPQDDNAVVASAAQRFAAAMSTGDKNRILPLLTEKAQQAVRNDRTFPLGNLKGMAEGAFVVGTPTITEDAAQVSVTIKEGKKDDQIILKLRREGGQWRVYGFGVPDNPLAPGTGFTMDFENPGGMLDGLASGLKDELEKGFKEAFEKPFQEAMEGKPGPEEEAIVDLKGLTPDQFAASWKDDLMATDKPAEELLRTLVEKQGLELKKNDEIAKELAKRVTVKLQGKSRWELVEEVCRQAGLYPEYPEDSMAGFHRGNKKSSVTLKKGPRSGPVTFAGPFLVEAISVKEYVPHATGILKVRILAAGLPAAVVSSLRETDPVRFDGVQDPQGKDLRDSRESMGWSIPGRTALVDLSRDIPLKNLLRGVSAIKSCQGKIKVSLPTRVETLVFDSITDGTTRKTGTTEVTLRKAAKSTFTLNNKPQDTLNVNFVFKGVPYGQIKFVAHDAQGGLLGGGGRGQGNIGAEGFADLTLHGRPASITAKVIAEVKDVDFDFKLENIRLPSHAKMPEKLEPARFTEKEPVAVEFLKIVGDPNFRKVRLKVVNHADKDIRKLDLRLKFLDAAGKNLKEDPTSYRPTSFDNDYPLVVNLKGTATIEAMAFFMPPQTQTVAVTVDKVIFADASDWSPPKPAKQDPKR